MTYFGDGCLPKYSLSSLDGGLQQLISTQLRIVNELLAQETPNRKRLADTTIELQRISNDANKLIGDIDVASRNLARMQEALNRTNDIAVALTAKASEHRQYLRDVLQYLLDSMDKQKMWMQNYRDRKDIAMSLVFNLVTQQDAANSFRIAQSMRKDSSSMNGIALLTMVFLPGTFTSGSRGSYHQIRPSRPHC